MKKLALRIVWSLLVVTLGSLLSHAQQLQIGVDQTTLPSVPVDYLITIQTFGSLTNRNLRAFIDDNQLPTVVANYELLYSAWYTAKGPGAHALKVLDDTNPTIFSNIVTFMVGQAPNVQICAGGLLPQDSDIATIAQYERTYDTLNCRYMDPPRCATGQVTSATLDCTE